MHFLKRGCSPLFICIHILHIHTYVYILVYWVLKEDGGEEWVEPTPMVGKVEEAVIRHQTDSTWFALTSISSTYVFLFPFRPLLFCCWYNFHVYNCVVCYWKCWLWHCAIYFSCLLLCTLILIALLFLAVLTLELGCVVTVLLPIVVLLMSLRPPTLCACCKLWSY
jgi:hypothetical protein